MKKLVSLLPIYCFLLLIHSCKESSLTYDIVVYGGTSAGVIAACSAKKEGKSVLLVEPGSHLGGLTSGGLGQTDIGNKYAVTGVSRDFYRRLGKHYGKLEAWNFEPHIAENIFNELVKEAELDVLMNYRLKKVKKSKLRITSITLEKSTDPEKVNDISVKGRYFIDCTYEGDLMAKAGVSYTVGRESNETYKETYNGVQMRNSHQFPDGIDPYIIPGDSASGLCYGIQSVGLAPQGTGDKKVQAYNYRLCLTDNPDNMVPVIRPVTYDASKYELLRRVLNQREEQGLSQKLGEVYLIISRMPNSKTDINNRGAFSTDGIGMNWDYPESGYARRYEIAEELEEYTRGLLYFMGNDPDVPQSVREQMQLWGWAKDEFVDNDHFPHQMYVREARRMVGEYVMTEHNCLGDSTVHDGIGLAAYTMDSHNCQRVVIVKDGKAMVKNEGDVQIGRFPPYDISYRSITPKNSECENLLVPVCLSASHIAFGSIRMEPVFMVLGQVAGLAVSLADKEGLAVQKVDVKTLKNRLIEDPLQNGTPPDIIIDNSDLSQDNISGSWEVKSYWMGQNKADFLLNLPASKGENIVRFPLPMIENKKYKVYTYVPQLPVRNEDKIEQWTSNAHFEIFTGSETVKITGDMNKYKYDWLPLGTFTFEGEGYIEIISQNQEYPVTADAILLVPEMNKLW